MVFLYKYQDREGELKEGEVPASSLSDAYSLLRKSGVRPMKVWPKPGVFNRLAIGKRWYAIIVLSVCVCLFALLAVTRDGSGRMTEDEGLAFGRLDMMSRRQVPECTVNFRYVSEATFLCFVRPGDVSRLPLAGLDAERCFSDLEEALRNPTRPDESDAQQVKDVKRIVLWLENEARSIVSSGASKSDLLQYLIGRQRMEAAYRDAFAERVKRGRVDLDAANQELRLMGIRELEK